MKKIILQKIAFNMASNLILVLGYHLNSIHVQACKLPLESFNCTLVFAWMSEGNTAAINLCPLFCGSLHFVPT